MDTAIEKIERALRIARLGYPGGVNVNLERGELEYLLECAKKVQTEHIFIEEAGNERDRLPKTRTG